MKRAAGAVTRGLILVAGVVACSDASGPIRGALPVASVTVSPGNGIIDVGETFTLTALPKDAAGNALLNRSVVWSSEAPSVAGVSSAGVVVGISPDSTRIIATSEGVSGTAVVTVARRAPDVGQIAVGRCIDDYCGLFVIDADGSNGRFLSVTPIDVAGDSDPTWSPDGKQIVVSSGRHCVAGARCYNELYVMNADGSGIRRLTNSATTDEWRATWSPDGRQLAFGAATYAADGQSISVDIYVMNVDGSGVRVLVPGPAGGSVFNPRWSPDGSRIAYATEQNRSFAIDVVSADGSTPVRVSRWSPSNGDVMGGWSPDGKKIAFTRHWFAPAPGLGDRCQVFVMNADGSNATQLTNDSFCATHPAWSPDGTRIALLANFGLGLGLSLMNPDGSGGVTLIGNSGFSAPAWSPVRSVSPR